MTPSDQATAMEETLRNFEAAVVVGNVTEALEIARKGLAEGLIPAPEVKDETGDHYDDEVYYSLVWLPSENLDLDTPQAALVILADRSKPGHEGHAISAARELGAVVAWVVEPDEAFDIARQLIVAAGKMEETEADALDQRHARIIAQRLGLNAEVTA